MASFGDTTHDRPTRVDDLLGSSLMSSLDKLDIIARKIFSGKILFLEKGFFWKTCFVLEKKFFSGKDFFLEKRMFLEKGFFAQLLI